MWHHFFLYQILFSGLKPFSKEVQTPVRDSSLICQKNRCEESETSKEEILKALEHHQTGKTPTHSRAKKALRSSQASLNGSLSANCTTQPLEWTTLLLLSIQIHMSAEWISGRAHSLLSLIVFFFFFFTLSRVTHPQSAVISTTVMSPCPAAFSLKS